MERTFVMVKPDGVQRGLIGEIVGALRAPRVEDRRHEDDAGDGRVCAPALCSA